jgi:hypothetical protein
MKIMRLGSSGPTVRRWQMFLLGQGFPVTPTGVFDTSTHAATRDFQKHHGLKDDGIVGNRTYGRAGLEGFELVSFLAEEDSGFPPLPNFKPLTSTTERARVFGHFDYVPVPNGDRPERIKILGDWERKNIVKVNVPQLAGVPIAGKTGAIRAHRLAAERMAGLFQAWHAAGLTKWLITWLGAFDPRFMVKSRTTLSNHAFGTAFDINAAWNQFGGEPALPGEQGCVFDLVGLAHQHGFYWGGHFRPDRDGMHFELAKL